MERGGNDDARIAAVLAVDENGEPTERGPIVTIRANQRGDLTDPMTSLVLRRDPGDTEYRPHTWVTAQRIAGVYVSLEELGISSGQFVYGFSMVALDQDSMTGAWVTTIYADSQGGVFATSIKPVANPVTSTGEQGAPQTIPLDTEPGDQYVPIDDSKTRIVPPTNGSGNEDGTVVTVPGEGTYTLDRDTGSVTFIPEEDFVGEATRIEYVVTDVNGGTASSTITATVTYLPGAQDDVSTGNTPGESVTVPVLENDKGDLDSSSVRITDPNTGEPVEELVVPGEGTWTVDPETGDITFTPEEGLEGNPTPIEYTVKDRDGNETGARVTVGYEEPGAGAPTTPPTNPAPGSGGDTGSGDAGGLATTGAEIKIGAIALGMLLALGGVALLLRRRSRH